MQRAAPHVNREPLGPAMGAARCSPAYAGLSSLRAEEGRQASSEEERLRVGFPRQDICSVHNHLMLVIVCAGC